MTPDLLILLLAFQAKHLIADYYLQYPYMYQNKGAKSGWIKPLFDHAITHAVLTGVIISAYVNFNTEVTLELLPLLSLFDFITHFIIDRWKATRKTDPSQSWFWKALGIDQMLHHIVGIIIIWWLVS